VRGRESGPDDFIDGHAERLPRQQLLVFLHATTHTNEQMNETSRRVRKERRKKKEEGGRRKEKGKEREALTGESTMMVFCVRKAS
jgi:hypothetical protein